MQLTGRSNPAASRLTDATQGVVHLSRKSQRREKIQLFKSPLESASWLQKFSETANRMIRPTRSLRLINM